MGVYSSDNKTEKSGRMSILCKKYQELPTQVKASFWFLICAFMQRGISFTTTPVFTRLLTTSEYGQYSVFISWYSIVAVFVSMNLYSGVYTRGLVKFEEDRNVFVSSLQGLCLTLVLMWTVVYLLFNNFWNDIFSLTTPQMLAMLLMVWTTAIFNFWSMEQRVDWKYRKLVVITIIVSLAKPILGIVLVVNAKDKVTARILGLLFVEFVAYIWLFFGQMLRGRCFFSKKYWKHALLFNFPLIPHYLSMNVLNSADRIMICNLTDAENAGIYNLAYSISQIMSLFNTALLQTLEPWVYKKIKANRIEHISKVAYPAFGCIAVVNILLIALAPEIIALFAPPAYYDAIWVIPPVVMSVYFMFAYTFFAAFEFYYEKTKYITMATMSGAVLNVILNYIFINKFGYYAAGYTTLFCYIVFAVCHYCCMRKICREYLNGVEAYNLRILLLVTGIFVSVGMLFMATYRHMIIRYGLLVLCIIAVIIKRHTLADYVGRIVTTRKSREET